MQVKALLVSAIAVAAVSAQSFDLNACSDCVFASFDKNAVCSKLPTNDMTSLKSVFDSGVVDVPKMSGLLQNPAIRECMCDWTATAFTPTGAANGCMTTAPIACNASQVAEAQQKLTPLTLILNCPKTTNKPPTATSPAGGAGGAGAGPSPTGAANVNLPSILSLAAVGVAAFFGL
ncbi:hypothetical protein DFQ27_009883 [Actinomortierella ambigua]|uniref:Uncharacterized protein n=1 Tax=Actinomortierella ambigua TaxID=1343610 RepID=A0A9P6PLW3_9FUNG|nr:hypothetical protein DFQ27_009883 [Actinomortierella ambigua]